MAVMWGSRTHLVQQKAGWMAGQIPMDEPMAGWMAPRTQTETCWAASWAYQSQWGSYWVGWMALQRLIDSQTAAQKLGTEIAEGVKAAAAGCHTGIKICSSP